ncbi:hypothetical protein [Stackebrandtia soli]|uniref:hypothetical protein n=1 Tax=Stackebrandtia soli TaxID=1892856 RepID=UPI0039EBDA48
MRRRLCALLTAVMVAMSGSAASGEFIVGSTPSNEAVAPPNTDCVGRTNGRALVYSMHETPFGHRFDASSHSADWTAPCLRAPVEHRDGRYRRNVDDSGHTTWIRWPWGDHHRFYSFDGLWLRSHDITWCGTDRRRCP